MALAEFGADGSASAVYAMANAWYGIDLGGITPFIGAGIGIANLTLDSQYDAPYTPASFDESGTTYAAQVGAGVSINVTESMALTARYRYFMTGDVDFTDGQGDTVTGQPCHQHRRRWSQDLVLRSDCIRTQRAASAARFFLPGPIR